MFNLGHPILSFSLKTGECYSWERPQSAYRDFAHKSWEADSQLVSATARVEPDSFLAGAICRLAVEAWSCLPATSWYCSHQGNHSTAQHWMEQCFTHLLKAARPAFWTTSIESKIGLVSVFQANMSLSSQFFVSIKQECPVMWEKNKDLNVRGLFSWRIICRRSPHTWAYVGHILLKKEITCLPLSFSLLTGWKWWQLEQLLQTQRQKPATWIVHLLLVWRQIHFYFI